MRRLLIRPGAIGDCILSLPAMEALRDGYLEVWAPAQNLPLIRFADRVRSIAATGLDLLGIPDRELPSALLETLAGFDSIVSWYGAARPEFRAAVAHLPVRFLPALPPEGSNMHAADFYLRQARGSEVPVLSRDREGAVVKSQRGDAIPRIDCPRWDGGFAVIHPFSGSPKKNWPLGNFRDVANRLSALMPVKWCAGPEEPLEGAVRVDNLYELGCWLAGARVYIGNDSGITHLAAAAGAPVVALFGPTDPAVWGPRGENVRILPLNAAVEQVLRAAHAMGRVAS